jgi:hypothetical protein
MPGESLRRGIGYACERCAESGATRRRSGRAVSRGEKRMRTTRWIVGLFAMGATLSSAGACTHNYYEASGEVAPSSIIGLTVRNDNFLDMDVYVVSEGLATRVGTVTGNSSAHFVLNESLASRDLRIVATPIGGNGRASSGSITVEPGQTIDFRIGSTLRNSSVIIR